ncbi:hypothetical protein M0805_004473 [Coniferiporia weirii]|nr:hypothetical protein M0805_004473 [Coniferiporia weirii]
MDPDEVNYAEMEPEYDMEFARYGPNPMQIPMSPPRTPTLADAQLPPAFQREPSPFSESSSMTSMDSAESVGYYREEGGRMFPSMQDIPVVLPVDHAEMRRVSNQYDLIKLATGERHYEQIDELLNPPYEASIHVLDVVCNSPWIDEMVREYPHVKFTGCNFVPTRHPHHPNIILEIYNLNDGLRGRDGSFDLIHAIGCFKFTTDFKSWLVEMKRLLRPGGVLVIIDLEMALWNCDGSDPWRTVPTICRYAERMYKALFVQGIDLRNMSLVGTWLRELGGFSEVDDTVTGLPVGDWDSSDEVQREIGIMVRDNITSALISTHPLWRRAGISQEELDHIVVAAHAELLDPSHRLFQRLFYTFARKEELLFEGEL